ncbi:uncharacterized protein PAC_13083 [Phialocephala subalpina]|uniref:C2H2-type domain-containing protein n=1 Tax=Phialocephala subalpina TaxID=576137 RepID=A0A1L7XDY9_9HELO|nr:uncharacterized protein PAC_13083 [Phialocephala subalpina]
MDANNNNAANGNQDNNASSEGTAKKTARIPLPSSPLSGRVWSPKHQDFIVLGPRQSTSWTMMNAPNAISTPTHRSASSAEPQPGVANLTADNPQQTQAPRQYSVTRAPEHHPYWMMQSTGHPIIQQEPQRAYQSPYPPRGPNKCPYCPAYLSSPQEMVDHIQTQH